MVSRLLLIKSVSKLKTVNDDNNNTNNTRTIFLVLSSTANYMGYHLLIFWLLVHSSMSCEVVIFFCVKFLHSDSALTCMQCIPVYVAKDATRLLLKTERSYLASHFNYHCRIRPLFNAELIASLD